MRTSLKAAAILLAISFLLIFEPLRSMYEHNPALGELFLRMVVAIYAAISAILTSLYLLGGEHVDEIGEILD